MERKKALTVSAILTTITGALGSVAVFNQEVRSMLDFIPSNERIERIEKIHHDDIQQIGAYAKGAYANTLPARIKNLLINRCRNPESFDAANLGLLLEELRSEYQEIVGREYAVGTCQSDGTYCNQLNVCEGM